MDDQQSAGANASDNGKAKPPVKRGSRKRLSREDRTNDMREAIFAAATTVIGQYGYGEAKMSRIAEEAGIAPGTIYLYFESRQALFDELLPHVGGDMIRFLSTRVKGGGDVYDVEERGFRAFFEYLKLNPFFFRILNEAEVAAPVAHERHFNALTERYVASLQRGVQSGQIRHFGPDELETLAYVFMAARSYLYLRFVKAESQKAGALVEIPESVVQTYLKLVREGLK